MTRKVLLRAHAKVNYALEVLGLREDGYHEIRSVMQSVSLADEVEIERAREGFDLRVEPEIAEVGLVEENTVYGVWKLLCGLAGSELPVRVRLRKKIPSGAGLGGGSADAAAALLAIDELFNLGLSDADLRDAGGRIGADVPFCLLGGTALAEGIGEVISPLSAPPDHFLVIAKPPRGADTGEIYRAYDRRQRENPEESSPCAAPVVEALRGGGLLALAGAVGNDLGPITSSLVPDVAACEGELMRTGALGAAMTGTGTAVYGLFGTAEDAESAAGRLDAPFTGVYEPVGYGIEWF